MELSPRFSRDDFAQILADALPSQNFEVNLTEELPLLLSDKRIRWRFPAVVLGERNGRKALVLPRFGDSYSPVPPYILTYVDAANRVQADLDVYLATPTNLAGANEGVCADQGWGLIEVSFDDWHCSVILEPGNAVNARLEELEVRAIALAEASRQRYVNDIEVARRRFHRSAKQENIGDPAQDDNYFDEELARARAIFNGRSTQANRAREHRDERALKELIGNIEAGKEQL